MNPFRDAAIYGCYEEKLFGSAPAPGFLKIINSHTYVIVHDRLRLLGIVLLHKNKTEIL